VKMTAVVYERCTPISTLSPSADANCEGSLWYRHGPGLSIKRPHLMKHRQSIWVRQIHARHRAREQAGGHTG